MSDLIDPYLMIQAFVDGEASPEAEAELLSLLDEQPDLKEELNSLRKLLAKMADVGEISHEFRGDCDEYFRTIISQFIGQASLEDLAEFDLNLLQAYVDGELSEDDNKKAKEMVLNDANALAAVISIRGQKNTISSLGESQMECVEDRDFYWSQISKQIQSDIPKSSDTVANSANFGFGALLKWISNPLTAPALVVGIFCFFLGGQLNNAAIYQEVQVSSAYVDSSSEIAVYFVDDPDFLTSSSY